jgi:hypothetical protein
MKRHALLIATSEYADSSLKTLHGAVSDAHALESILAQEVIGGYEVTTLLNKPHYEVMSAIERFALSKKADDLLLIYFSCHGAKDGHGRLYFASQNTQLSELRSTAIPSGFINDILGEARSKQKILILDCCYSGAFLKGVVNKADRQINIQDKFSGGKGLYVLTASSSVDYAFEEAEDGTPKSAFTAKMIQGIRTGDADRDNDGWIGVTELYQHITEEFGITNLNQKPELNNFRVQGEIFITRTNRIYQAITITADEAKAGGNKAITIDDRIIEISIPKGVHDGYLVSHLDDKGPVTIKINVLTKKKEVRTTERFNLWIARGIALMFLVLLVEGLRVRIFSMGPDNIIRSGAYILISFFSIIYKESNIFRRFLFLAYAAENLMVSVFYYDLFLRKTPPHEIFGVSSFLIWRLEPFINVIVVLCLSKTVQLFHPKRRLYINFYRVLSVVTVLVYLFLIYYKYSLNMTVNHVLSTLYNIVMIIPWLLRGEFLYQGSTLVSKIKQRYRRQY